MSIIDRILRAGEGKKRKLLNAVVEAVNSYEPEISSLTDSALQAKTAEFKQRLENGESLDDLMPEAFAVVRETARRILGQRHFDVQIKGGAALHFGWIAEMKTGEGKTLVSTLPVYLNALEGKGVHMVTVNDYLAKRDAEWMGAIHRFLGLSVGLILPTMPPSERKKAYLCDITYGTNNEFGFDYLRDNMAMSKDEIVQRGHHYAIVDEADSILIDEARTPLIISGRLADSARWYARFAEIAQRLRRDVHYEVDEAKYQVAVTEEGVAAVEAMLGIENLYDHANADLVHHLNVALKAKELYKRDVDYLVRDGEVLIVDEFTGRILHGRRYSEGLHQAIEAKERVRIKEENQTLATITIQNYFRMYEKLAGMTGTAVTEAAEFAHTYNLEVVEIETNLPVRRIDHPDVVYKTEDAKFRAIVDDIAERYERGQPVLVGTISIEKSERLSRYLSKRGIPHSVLNAKHHEKEAAIIAQAGRLHAVTVATNMAGRGVDIMLGGNPEYLAKEEYRKRYGDEEIDLEKFEPILEHFKKQCAEEREKVIALGGLYVIGTERHESRRIDNQLRGRSGRQGDPGESRFYLSLEDDLMRLFASDRVAWVMERLKVPDDVPIEAKMVTKVIERAQRQVEAQNFEIRKNVLKYDDVMNKQREVIYKIRRQVLEGEDIHEEALEYIVHVIEKRLTDLLGDKDPSEYDYEEILTYMKDIYPVTLGVQDLAETTDSSLETILEKILDDALAQYRQREEELGSDQLREIERLVLLSVIDRRWIEHLYEMDYLREGIHLRAMGQEDPLVAYQRDGFDMFVQMMEGIKEDFVRSVFRAQVVTELPQRRVTGVREIAADASEATGGAIKVGEYSKMLGMGVPGSAEEGSGGPERSVEPVRSQKVGRNAPCPCGSGKKYKLCCGAVKV
jgi:preprotein translocase subunit SecA